MGDQETALWESSWEDARSLAYGAEMFLHLATETLGDIDTLTSSLYIQATGLSLLGESVYGLPMSAEKGRQFSEEMDLRHRSPKDDPTIIKLSEQADAVFPDLLGFDFLVGLERDETLRPAGTSEPVRRRRICSVLATQLQAVEDPPSSYEYSGTEWEQIAKALTFLAPVTLVPYCLRPRIGSDGDFTTPQIEKALSVSSATIQRWKNGTHIPNNQQSAQLDEILGYSPGTMQELSETRTGRTFTWESIKDRD